MNRRGFLGAIGAAIAAAKTGLLPKTPLIAREELNPTLLPPVTKYVDLYPPFKSPIFGVALEAATAPGLRIPVMIHGTTNGPHHSVRVEAAAPIQVGHFLAADDDGRVRPVEMFDSSVPVENIDNLDAGMKPTSVSLTGCWDIDDE